MNHEPPRIDLTNASHVIREARAGLANYVPVIFGRTGWVLEEEGGTTVSSTKNLKAAIEKLGEVVSVELVEEGAVFVLKCGAILCTGFSWWYHGEGPTGFAHALVDHTTFAKDVQEAMTKITAWPKEKRGIIWGKRVPAQA